MAATYREPLWNSTPFGWTSFSAMIREVRLPSLSIVAYTRPMVRVPWKIVPLSPRAIMRAPGLPCAHSSTWNPAGTWMLFSGMSSGAVTVILPGCPVRCGFFIRSGW